MASHSKVFILNIIDYITIIAFFLLSCELNKNKLQYCPDNFNIHCDDNTLMVSVSCENYIHRPVLQCNEQNGRDGTQIKILILQTGVQTLSFQLRADIFNCSTSLLCVCECVYIHSELEKSF